MEKPKKIMKKIVVAGDVAIDWMEFSIPSFAHYQYNWQAFRGTSMFARPGGAYLMAQFVKNATGMPVISQDLPEPIENIPPDRILHSMSFLKAFEFSKSQREPSVYP